MAPKPKKLTRYTLLLTIFASVKRLRRRMVTQGDLLDDTVYQIQHAQEIKKDLDALMEIILDEMLPQLEEEEALEVIEARYPTPLVEELSE